MSSTLTCYLKHGDFCVVTNALRTRDVTRHGLISPSAVLPLLSGVCVGLRDRDRILLIRCSDRGNALNATAPFCRSLVQLDLLFNPYLGANCSLTKLSFRLPTKCRAETKTSGNESMHCKTLMTSAQCAKVCGTSFCINSPDDLLQDPMLIYLFSECVMPSRLRPIWIA